MAHEISNVSGKHEFAAFKTPGWHGLGETFQEKVGIEKGIELAYLNWTVGKAPNIHRLPDGTEIVSDRSFFTFREDSGTILGPSVGPQYEVIQHTEAFSVIQEVLTDGHYLETAGAVRNGEFVFAVVKMNESLFVDGQERTDLFMLFLACHNGSKVSQVSLTPVRVVCMNTLRAALRNITYQIKLRHSGDVQAKVEEAAKIIDSFRKSQVDLRAKYQKMMDTRITTSTLLSYIVNVMASTPTLNELEELQSVEALTTRVRNTISDILVYMENGPGQNGGETLWDAYNGITGYLSNVREYKGYEHRFENLLMDGTAAQYNQRALSLADNPDKIKQVDLGVLTSLN